MPPQFSLKYDEMEAALPGLPARFALLGLFPPDYGITPEEAAGVWAALEGQAPEVERSLALLQERRLIDRVPGRAPLYRVPPVVRQLATERLDQEAELRARGQAAMITYYAGFAAQHGEGLPEDIGVIADVYDAVNQALGWAEQTHRWTEAAALARGLCRFLYMRRMTNQYRDVLRRGMFAAQQARRVLDQAWFLREAGALAADNAEYTQAIDLYEQSINLYRDMGDERNEAQGLYEWARAEIAQGHYEAGRHLINESMDIMRELQHGVLQPTTLHDLADLSLKQGLFTQARRELEEALNAEIDRGDLAAQAATLVELGDLAANEGQAQQAVDYYLRSLTMARQRRDRRQGGFTLTSLGLLAALANDSPTATRCWIAARALLEAEQAPEVAAVERALSHHLGAARASLPPDAERRALAEWWGV